MPAPTHSISLTFFLPYPSVFFHLLKSSILENNKQSILLLFTLLLQCCSCSLLYIIVCQIPIHKVLETLIQVCRWLVAKLSLGKRDISMCKRNIPISGHFDEGPLGFHSKVALQNVHQGGYCDWRGVAKIKNPEHGYTLLFAPTPCAPSCCIKRCHTPIHNVINVRKIPSQVFVVLALVYVDRFPSQNITSKRKVCHVWPTPRPIDCKKPKSSYGEPIYMVICMCNFLPSLFCSSIQACWLICSVTLWEGNLQLQFIKMLRLKKRTEKHLYRIMLGRLTQKLQPQKTRVSNSALRLAKVQYEVHCDKAQSASEKLPNQR